MASYFCALMAMGGAGWRCATFCRPVGSGAGADRSRVTGTARPAEAGRAVGDAGGSGGGLNLAPDEPSAAALGLVARSTGSFTLWFSDLWSVDCGSPLVGCHAGVGRVRGRGRGHGPPVQVCQTLVLTTFGAAVTATSSMTGPAAALTPIGDWAGRGGRAREGQRRRRPVAANEKVCVLPLHVAGRVLRNCRVVGECGLSCRRQRRPSSSAPGASRPGCRTSRRTRCTSGRAPCRWLG